MYIRTYKSVRTYVRPLSPVRESVSLLCESGAAAEAGASSRAEARAPAVADTGDGADSALPLGTGSSGSSTTVVSVTTLASGKIGPNPIFWNSVQTSAQQLWLLCTSSFLVQSRDPSFKKREFDAAAYDRPTACSMAFPWPSVEVGACRNEPA